MAQPKLKVEEVAVADLVPYVGNAKLHPREQVERIAQSIMEFGFNDPIAVWHNPDGELEIVEGHGRLLALRRLRRETAPVIFLDHLSDAQRRAYTHVHNQLAIAGELDLEAVQQEIEAIGIDLEGYGFDFGFADTPAEREEVEPPEAFTVPMDVFDVLFVAHGEEEQRWLASFLNVTALRPRFDYGEVF